ncbi:MAG: tetratricopeptide repeat protein [Hyphomicrobium sp.]
MIRPDAVLAIALFAASLSPVALRAEPPTAFKDQGPAGPCDVHATGGPAWTACVGTVRAGMPDSELFYAGYWLARSGRYAEAIGYLTLAKVRDERVLTYIGFATRKLGDVDGALPLYAAALARNPDYSVARAYLGEAYLSKDEPAKARQELAEIERRCGRACAEYADLAGHIAGYEAARRRG